MHLSVISLCDRVGYNVKDDESKQRVLAELQRLCRFVVIRRHVQKFEAGAHLPLLSRAPHVVTVRSNGNPYVLFLTRCVNNNTPTCFFVDKKVQQGYHLPRIILVNMWFSASAFRGSAFEGEMIKNRDGSWQFAISDVLSYEGRHLVDTGFPARRDLLHEVFVRGAQYRHDPSLPFSVTLKPYWQVRDLEPTVLAPPLLAEWPHTCRGLLFKPMHLRFKDILLNFDDSQVVKNTRAKVGGNFCESLERVASASSTGDDDDVGDPKRAMPAPAQPAVPMWARKGALPDQYELFMDEACSTRAQPPTACVPCLATSKMLAAAFRCKTLVDRVRVECVMSRKFGKWEPVTCGADGSALGSCAAPGPR